MTSWLNSLSPGGYNDTETGWKDARTDKLIDELSRTVDEAKRKELAFEAQKILHDEGGYIIWGFSSQVDAVSSKVSGIEPNVALPLGRYAFKDAKVA
jgi:peptide/nickel transport system substrate-binding protein